MSYAFSNRLTLQFCSLGRNSAEFSVATTSISTSPATYPFPGSITFTSLSLPFSIIGVKMQPIPDEEIMSKSGIDV